MFLEFEVFVRLKVVYFLKCDLFFDMIVFFCEKYFQDLYDVYLFMYVNVLLEI